MFDIKPKSLILTILAAFIAIFATDFLIHQVILKADYAATASVWRAPEEMKMPMMMLGQLILAITFSMLYARGFASGCLSCALIYGVIIGVMAAGTSLIYYAVLPITGTLVVKWIAFGILKGAILGLIAFLVYGKGKVDPSLKLSTEA